MYWERGMFNGYLLVALGGVIFQSTDCNVYGIFYYSTSYIGFLSNLVWF